MKNYWFVIGSRDGSSCFAPMVEGYADDTTLYFGHEVTLYTTYSQARAAIARTKRRTTMLTMEIRRGAVKP